MAYYPVSARRSDAPPAPAGRLLSLDNLRGVDLMGSPATVSLSRSPDGENMIRSTPGHVRKRMGFAWQAHFPGAINGRYFLNGQALTHAGTALYHGQVSVQEGLADAKSRGLVFAGRLFLLDGAELWVVSPSESPAGFTVCRAKDTAYCPRILISKNPDGTGGVPHEGVNLLSDAWSESFYVSVENADATRFQLAFSGLSATPVTGKKLGADGVSYVPLTEGTDFTVNRDTGAVTFALAPGQSPAQGVDNVFLTAAKNRESQRRKITLGNLCVAYGEYGRGQRMFVAGSPDFPNRDFWSEPDDPTYFSDLSYCVLGSDSEAIVGYSLVGDCIAAHKGPGEGAVFLRRGTLIAQTDDAGGEGVTTAFPIVNVALGPGAVARDAFAQLGGECLFLTRRGVYALTAADVTGEKYQQSRSYYINTALCAEPSLEKGAACIYGDFYVLALGGRLYCLDGLQKATAQGEPYSAFQYEGFILTGVPARVLWVENGRLHFGTGDGDVCAFPPVSQAALPLHYADKETQSSEPVAISAHWDTPYLTGDVFYKNKSFRRLSLLLAAGADTGVTALARYRGAWRTVFSAPGAGRYFLWTPLSFATLPFSGDRTPRTLSRPMGLKKADKIQLRIENNALYQSMGLEALGVEYTQGGNAKA